MGGNTNIYIYDTTTHSVISCVIQRAECYKYKKMATQLYGSAVSSTTKSNKEKNASFELIATLDVPPVTYEMCLFLSKTSPALSASPLLPKT